MLVEHASLDMGPMGPMSGMSIWTFDEGSEKYKMWWFDSFGETSEVIATWNDRRKTWRLKSTGQKYGHSTSGFGTIRLIEDGVLEWTWVEQDALGVITFARMQGTSRRVAATQPVSKSP